MAEWDIFVGTTDPSDINEMPACVGVWPSIRRTPKKSSLTA
jgi:hypothetical protein